MDDGVWVLQERLEMRPDLLGGRTHFGEPFLSYWNGEHLALYFFCAAPSALPIRICTTTLPTCSELLNDVPFLI